MRSPLTGHPARHAADHRRSLQPSRLVSVVLVAALGVLGTASTAAAEPTPGFVYSLDAQMSDVGSAPAVNSASRTMYVADSERDRVSVVDLSTLTVTKSVAVGDFPAALGVDEASNTVFVVNRNADSVSVLDGGTQTVVATVRTGGSPNAVAVDPATHTAYVTDRDGVLAIHDLTPTRVAAVPSTRGIAVDPTVGRIYVTSLQADGLVTVIDAATSTVVATVPVGPYPFGVGVDTSTNTVYTAVDGGTVTLIDGKTNTVSGTVKTPSSLNGFVAVDARTQTVYVAPTQYDQNVYVLDGQNRTVYATIPVGVLHYHPLAVDSSTRTLYAAKADRSVSVIGQSDTSTRIQLTDVTAAAGSSVRLVATVTPAPRTGTVSFAPRSGPGCQDVPVDPSTGAASCMVTAPTTPEPYPVRASYSGGRGYESSRTLATLSVVAGPATQLVISPEDSGVTAGSVRDFAAHAADRYGNRVENRTATSTFTISPDGACNGATCTATSTGAHTVTAVDGDLRGTTSVTVYPSAMTQLSLTPSSASMTAGGSQTYFAIGRDQYGNQTGDVTSDTTFSIAPEGSCTGSTCTATRSGGHTVTAVNGTSSATASLSITAAAPAAVTAAAGNNQSAAAGMTFTTPLSVALVDAYGNPVPAAAVTYTITTAPSGTAGAASFSGGLQAVTVSTDSAGQATSPQLLAGAIAGSVVITATTTGAGGPVGATFTETVTAAGSSRADLAVTVTGPPTIARGGTATLTVTVTNKGPQAAIKVLTGVYLGPNLSVINAAGGSMNFGTDLLLTPTLQTGQKTTYVITVKAAAKKSTNTVTAGTASTTTDPTLTNNLAKTTITVS